MAAQKMPTGGLVSQTLGLAPTAVDEEDEDERRRKALAAAQRAGQGLVSGMLGQGGFGG